MKFPLFDRWVVRLLLALMLPLACAFAFLICQEIHEVSEIAGISSFPTGQVPPPKPCIMSKSLARHPDGMDDVNRMKGFATQAPAKEVSASSVQAESSEPVTETFEDAPDTAPPFLYEIKSSKMALLDQDQQLAVQKAFESYLALQQTGGGNADFAFLKESSEKLKEQLAAEIGPITVHDLMQGE